MSHQLALRGVLTPSGEMVLIDPFLVRSHPVIERLWARHGLRIVDALTITLAPDATHAISAIVESSDSVSPPGHAVLDPGEAWPVHSVLWAAYGGALETTEGQIQHMFTRMLRNGDRDERLDKAQTLASRLDVQLVNLANDGALVTSLQRSR